MKLYVWLTFGFMGWAYYEMSGGADFVPEQRLVAEVEVEQPEVVTRADTTTLLSVSSSNVQPEPAIEAIQVAAPVTTPEPEVPEVVEVAAPVVEPDFREVASSRVNMRMGPSTDYDVITTLDRGTRLEVLSVDDTGWANVSTELGIEGWMAERLLTAPDT